MIVRMKMKMRCLGLKGSSLTSLPQLDALAQTRNIGTIVTSILNKFMKTEKDTREGALVSKVLKTIVKLFSDNQ